MHHSSVDVSAGNIVYILDELRLPVTDKLGEPCIYQVVAVYRETNRVGLVTSYGEYIGTHEMKDILYVSDGPIFKKEEYEEGTLVVWVDEEDVYEGVIELLHESTAKISNIKKLMPVDHKVRIPYWKIPEGRKSTEESTTSVIHTIIGDDLD